MHRALVLTALAAVLGCATKSDGPTRDGSSNPSPAACTEIGCQDGLTIRVTPSSGWPAGSYSFTVTADGTTTTCTGSLPLPACEERALTCDGEGVQIVESGCALDPAEHAFGDISFASSPASVEVSVQRDGQAVGTGSFQPTYETVMPNGPDCPPTCQNATAELALSFG